MRRFGSVLSGLVYGAAGTIVVLIVGVFILRAARRYVAPTGGAVNTIGNLSGLAV